MKKCHLYLLQTDLTIGISAGKEFDCIAGNMGPVPGLGRSGGGHGNPLQYSCLENLHGQRGLAGYSPCVHKESDMTEQGNTAQHLNLYHCVSIYLRSFQPFETSSQYTIFSLWFLVLHILTKHSYNGSEELQKNIR